MADAPFPPFPEHLELIRERANVDISGDLHAQLDRDLSCAVLDELGPNLELFARKSSENIDSINRQLQKGRKIVLNENPKLHLVWDYGIIYIKPLPHYLLNHSFWIWMRNFAPVYCPQALGFMRSYERLIRYSSDFELAKEAKLIPSIYSSPFKPSQQPTQKRQQRSQDLRIEGRSETALTYEAFSAFIRGFAGVQDTDVSPRWHFGQIRLSRLHWAVRIFQPKTIKKGSLQRLFYEEQFWQTTQFLNEFAAPLLFVFAALSLMLSAMQVVLAAKSGDVKGSWYVFGEVSAWCAIVVIVMLVTVLAGLGTIIVGTWVWQFQFGFRSWKRSRRILGP